ncbi:MAG TPA: hypothetical protein VK836_03190 [Streptosporangiaceae bacterium]|nr:hypothetical protein [Streptosporangiaceae bacterium]
MLNTTPAMAGATTVQTVDAYASQAAQRPLAGFGAGAFTRDGACSGSQVSKMAAALAVPRIKRVKACAGSAITGGAKAGLADATCTNSRVAGTQVSIAQLGIVPVDTVQAGSHNFIQMARQYPVIPGGVGPHPAREPVPV